MPIDESGMLASAPKSFSSANMVPPPRKRPMKKRIVQKGLSQRRCMKMKMTNRNFTAERMIRAEDEEPFHERQVDGDDLGPGDDRQEHRDLDEEVELVVGLVLGGGMDGGGGAHGDQVMYSRR